MKDVNSVPAMMEFESVDSAKKHVSSGTASKPIMSKARLMKNLLIVCLGFLCLFSAYQALANLQSTLNIEGNLGLVSQSIIYAALIISSLFLPKLIIRRFGCKVTLAMCILTYSPYVAANFYPHMGTLVPTSILIGVGAAPLWASKCTYLNEISVLYADQISDTAEVVTSRFFGIFFMIFQNTQIWGNLVSYMVLKPDTIGIDENSSDDPLNMAPFSRSMTSDGAGLTISNVTCGAEFCFGINENLKPPSDQKRYTLIGIYFSFTILAALIVALFLDPLPKKNEDDNESVFSKVAATLKHLKKTDQMLLVPLTIYSGIEQAFIWGDYTKAYVACAWGTYNVGLVFICFGVVNAIMSFLAGRLVKYVSRLTIMLVGATGNIVVCIVFFLWEPNSQQYVVFFVLVGIWGLSDAVWQTQINALYGVLFRNEEEAAFANYRLWESVGLFAAFGYSSFLCVVPKIIVVIVMLIIGMTGYIIVEIRSFRRKKSCEVTTKM